MSLTLEKLAARLKAEGFNEDFYCIGSDWKRLTNGYALAAVTNGFEFFYTERGEKNTVKFFDDENEACRCAYAFLSNEKWAKTHLIGFFQTREQAENLIAELQKINIAFHADSIPYGGTNDRRYRVFIFGNDFQQVKNLIQINVE